MATSRIQGFKVIRIQFSEDSSAQHQVYIKEHSVRHQSDNKPAGRTLFVLNVPPYATERSFTELFSVAGVVESVTFSNKLTNYSHEQSSKNKVSGFKVAYIVFEKPMGLLKALKLETCKPLSTPDVPILTGLEKWVKEYNASICDHKELQNKVNSFMNEYDKAVEEQKLKEKKSETDDEGWTVVTKHGRNPGLSRKESVRNNILKKGAVTGSKKKNLLNFYTFQIRETKQRHIAELRKKFEEDKKRIEIMKQARTFKPF